MACPDDEIDVLLHPVGPGIGARVLAVRAGDQAAVQRNTAALAPVVPMSIPTTCVSPMLSVSFLGAPPYQRVYPPSTMMSVPVQYEEASLARNSTTPCSSSGFAMRFMGILSTHWVISASEKDSASSVRV